jgi:hypothetical protein
MPGDEISIDGTGVTVNGAQTPNSVPKAWDPAGRDLACLQAAALPAFCGRGASYVGLFRLKLRRAVFRADLLLLYSVGRGAGMDLAKDNNS